MGAYAVALVVDPKFGERLEPLARRIHTWIVDTPDNVEAAKQFWALPEARDANIENGITTFACELDRTPEQWCADIIDTLDVHHNRYSHTPGYTLLEVYGARATSDVREALSEFGFMQFDPTNDGFLARKNEP